MSMLWRSSTPQDEFLQQSVDAVICCPNVIPIEIIEGRKHEVFEMVSWHCAL